jgi:hypothetical protein
MHPFRIAVTALFVLAALVACPGKREGTVEGFVTPPIAGGRVLALQQGRTIAAADIDQRDGRFRIALPAGSYDISITAPNSPYPLMLSGIAVAAGATTTLAPVSLAPASGTAAITGRVLAAGTGTRLTLLAEGVERASVNTDASGLYEFTGLPAGRYTVEVASPGYANDSFAFDIADKQRTVRNVRMLYVTSITGVDWNSGRLRARGIGAPPKQAPTPTVKREMARRAAIVDAERNLLKAVEQINTAPDEKLTAALGGGSSVQNLQGYLQGYRVAAERDLDGGRIEVEIELPLTGPGGLSSRLQP